MNFLKTTNDIIDFVIDNFSNDQLTYVRTAPLDLDKYKAKNTVFFDFERFNFETLSNVSNVHNISLNLHIVVRNDTSENLRERLLNYASDFYDFFQTNKTFGGVVDNSSVDNINFYFDTSGQNIIQIATMELKLSVEEC